MPKPKPKSSSHINSNNLDVSITSNSKMSIPSNTTIGEFTVWKLWGNKSTGRLAADKYKPFGLKNFTGTRCT